MLCGLDEREFVRFQDGARIVGVNGITWWKENHTKWITVTPLKATEDWPCLWLHSQGLSMCHTDLLLPVQLSGCTLFKQYDLKFSEEALVLYDANRRTYKAVC